MLNAERRMLNAECCRKLEAGSWKLTLKGVNVQCQMSNVEDLV
jgi:hypothetical protein